MVFILNSTSIFKLGAIFLINMTFAEINHRNLSGEFKVEPSLIYDDLTRVLTESARIFSTAEGAEYLLNKRQEVIGRLEAISNGRIVGIFSTGYPNYVATPDFSATAEGQLMVTGGFQPVPEILDYVSRTLRHSEDHRLDEIWPCPECDTELAIEGLRADACGECGITPTPFFLYTTIPDLDFYLVLEDLGDAEQIIADARSAGIESPENRMVETITEFPGSIHADLHLIGLSDFQSSLREIEPKKSSNMEVTVPVLHYYGSLIPGQIHLGLDFAFSLFPHLISHADLRREYFRRRAQFVMRQEIDAIILRLKLTSSKPHLPQRIGRLVGRYPTVEEELRSRLRSYREVGIDGSTSHNSYIVVSNTNIEALYELYEDLAEKEDSVFVVDESLFGFLGEYAPSFVVDLNESTGTDYYYNQENIRMEQAANLAMTHGALDNILFEGNASPQLLEDRLRRLTEVMVYLGLSTNEIDDYIVNLDEKSYAETTFFTKRTALQLYRHFAREPQEIQALQPSANEYPFVEPLRIMFGDNLREIVLYGSSTQLREGNDYDLLVFVDEISEQFCADLENRQREINALCGRDVHLIVIPRENLQTYLSLNTIPVEEMELVYGSALEIPRFSEDLGLEAAYQASRIIRSMGSIQRAFRDPEYYVQKPQVLHGHLKLPEYLIKTYEAIFKDRLLRDFFDQLYSAFETPEFKKELSLNEVKELRAKTIHDLFMISQIVSSAIM